MLLKRSSTELKILALGFPIVVGQLGTILTSFADTFMVGHYSTASLASASFVNNMFNMAIFTVIGFTYGLTPLIGREFLREESRPEIGRLLRAGLWLNAAVSLLVMAIMFAFYLCLDRLGQPEELLPVIRPYFLLYLVGLLPVSVFNVFAQWSYSVNRTVLPSVILIVGNLLNIAGNYALIFGHWGCPEMGLTGAGLSTLAVRVLNAVAMGSVFFFGSRNRREREGFKSLKVTGKTLSEVGATSWPVALQMGLESGCFSVAAVMAGWVGATGLAAYQIAVVIGQLGFMVYYGFGTAIAVLVANKAGLGDRREMRRVAFAGYRVILCFVLLASAAFFFFGGRIIDLFTDDPAVRLASVALVIPLVLYQFGDGTQVCFANALRGTADVRPMLWIAAVAYLLFGVPAMYLLAFPLGLETVGILSGAGAALLVAALLFLSRFLRATR